MEGNHLSERSGETLGLAQRRAAIGAATVGVRGLREVLFQATGDELAEVLGEVDALGQACDAARVAVTTEAVERGEVGTGPRALTLTQWLYQHAPSLRSGGAGQVVALAAAFGKAVNEPVRAAVEDGGLPVRAAAVVLTEADRLRPRLADGAEPHVLAGLIDVAQEPGCKGPRLLRAAMLARYGAPGELQHEQDIAGSQRALSAPRDDGLGLFEYTLRLDVEAKIVLEAALSPLSSPQPVKGEPDLRCAQRRRADALLELVRRAVAAPDGVPAHTKAQLLVTVDYTTLADGLRGGGSTLGGLDAGILLAPETVRRLACDASLIPVVLSTRGEVLDWGAVKRLFTPAQTRRLWLRDGGCTYPSCTAPASWTDAHHLVHWADGGLTDLSNAALLCGRHHTVVHQRRLAGSVTTDTGGTTDTDRTTDTDQTTDTAGQHVEWDLTRGSYDALLARRAAQEPA